MLKKQPTQWDKDGAYVDDARDASAGAEWIEALVTKYADGKDPAKDVLDEVAAVAEALESASIDLRAFISDYYKFSGAIDAASSAIEAFGKSPNAATREVLMRQAKPLEGHRIAMPEKLRRLIRPHVKKRAYRSVINFGSLHFIVRDHVQLDSMAEAA